MKEKNKCKPRAPAPPLLASRRGTRAARSEQTARLTALLADFGNNQRHYEIQRASATGFLVTLYGGLFAFALYDKDFNKNDLPVCGAMAFFALFGALFSRKMYQRARTEERRGDPVREWLLLDVPDVDAAIKRQDDYMRAKYCLISKIRTRSLWMALHLLVVAAATIGAIYVWHVPAPPCPPAPCLDRR